MKHWLIITGILLIILGLIRWVRSGRETEGRLEILFGFIEIILEILTIL